MQNAIKIFVVLFFLMNLQLKASSDVNLEFPSTMMVEVFAGNDTSVCYGSNLEINDLNAFINGVADGNWFTSGTGVFLPGSGSSGLFSNTTTYIPSNADYAAGSVVLTLVSDDPDGPGVLTQVNDAMILSFQSAPALACTSNLNVSLDYFCEQQLDIFMLITNPITPYGNYYIESFDENGQLIPDNLLTSAHRNQNISFSVGHICGGSTCWGNIYVEDKLPPNLICLDHTISCDEGFLPEDLGLPIPLTANAVPSGMNSYNVEDFDACTDVILEYSDELVDLACANGYESRIDRTWIATDEDGNSSSCVEQIYRTNLGLSDVVFPLNYDDLDLPSLSCSGNWPSLPSSGYPDPSYTGYPSTMLCSNLEATYDDIEFPICGGGYKILREWLVIDWCSSSSASENQIIKIEDKEAPIIACQADVTLNTNAYTCSLTDYQMVVPLVTDNCSAFDYSAYLLDDLGEEIHLNINNGLVLIEEMNLGNYIYRIIAEDECGNKDTCNTNITIVDQAPPYVSCDQLTSVSLGIDGIGRMFATTLDDGSWDNCGIDRFEVAKMTDECGFGLEFGPYVDFCCSEVATVVMVALRVYDIYGNYNDCMVEVEVEEKLPPVISCPSNITLSCDHHYDMDNLDEFGTIALDPSDQNPILVNGVTVGYDGLALDNCNVTIEHRAINNISCHEGEIIRIFTAWDDFGQSDECYQVISFINNNPFSEDDIIWPPDYTDTGCQEIEDNVIVTGEPTFTNEICSNVDATYVDQVFNIVEGSCIKIIREWTVIDWCQFDDQTLEGTWNYTQTIKQNNTVGPQFTSTCQDTTICIVGDPINCEGIVQLSNSAIDDCTSEEDLSWNWFIDINDDGNFEHTGTGDSLEILLPQGEYFIRWHVEDRCGNLESCDYYFVVKECKLPTPYCTSSLTTVIMPSAGEITINAIDFELNSTDNCTPYEDLKFSFSSNTSDVTRTYTCDSLINGIAQAFDLQLWVTDLAGNQDYCSVMVTIQDNNDSCSENVLDGSISGNAKTYSGYEVENVSITYEAGIPAYSGEISTNQNGNYNISEVPAQISYDIDAVKSDGLLTGVSTLDIFLIQKHILQLKEFTNPYDVIAADVNKSNSVSGVDLVFLRKALLGINLEFPNDNDPWRFVDKNHVFTDTLSPWGFDESISFEPLTSNTNEADFVAIKIGDVNGTLNEDFLKNGEVEQRSTNGFNLSYSIEENDDHVLAHFYSSNRMEINGYQFALNYNSVDYQFVEILSNGLNLNEENINSFDQEIRSLWYSMEPRVFEKNQTIFSLKFSKSTSRIVDIALQIANSIESQIIQDDQAFDLSFSADQYHKIEDELPISTNLISPNPFKDNLVIDLTKHQDVESIDILDQYGNEIKSISYPQTYNTRLKIDSKIFPTTGVYYFVFQTNSRRFSERVVFIND